MSLNCNIEMPSYYAFYLTQQKRSLESKKTCILRKICVIQETLSYQERFSIAK